MCRKEIPGIPCGSGSIGRTSRVCAGNEKRHPRQTETRSRPDNPAHGQIQPDSRMSCPQRVSPSDSPLRRCSRLCEKNPQRGGRSHRRIRRSVRLINIREKRHRRGYVRDRRMPIPARHSIRCPRTRRLNPRTSISLVRIRSPRENRAIHREPVLQTASRSVTIRQYPKMPEPRRNRSLRYGRNVYPQPRQRVREKPQSNSG